MDIRVINSGPVETNSYIISAGGESEVVVIDPASRVVFDFIMDRGLRPVLIINTHGHFDHIAGNCFFEGVDIAIHKRDMDMLTCPDKNLSVMFGQKIVSPEAAHILSDREIIKVGDIEIEVLHTPGHTGGSVCLKIADVLFTGDTLFAGSIGRTDLPGGDYEKIMDSIKRLLEFPDDTIIYPGHGLSSTIGKERRTNVYICSI